MFLRYVIEDIKEDEGFRGMPYKDSLGKETIGYGTLLPLNKKESIILLKYRLEKNVKEFDVLYRKNRSKGKPFSILGCRYESIIMNMVYQLGAKGVIGFDNMLEAMENDSKEDVKKHMRDSKWYKQTPNRVENLIKKYLC